MKTISARQMKAARALLGWSEDDLAARAGLKRDDLAGMEEEDLAFVAPPDAAEAVVQAFAAAGIEFLNAGGEVGVRLCPAPEVNGLRPSELNAANDG
ncbi:transcriptional regulator [Propylenella binzhouense]|uniref:Transcriptional regulator n=1 Tax=Propylenella binzhouense TaxID=2555902 RepID=A0A964T5K1_9HYPH|nr:transcriptional regulator [Propylenella binzhouense]MYZ48825.1 transcriptional regulator [Propylenella binzhouense]